MNLKMVLNQFENLKIWEFENVLNQFENLMNLKMVLLFLNYSEF